MKRLALSAALLLFSVFVNAQSRMTNEAIMEKVSKGKPFTLVFLKAGEGKPPAGADMKQMQMDHLAGLFQMEKEGSISIFGPVNNDPVFRGIIIFNTTDKEAIKKQLNNDPFIKNGLMKFEMLDWFSIPGQKLPDA
jgi:uncharacterized protein YciI